MDRWELEERTKGLGLRVIRFVAEREGAEAEFGMKGAGR